MADCIRRTNSEERATKAAAAVGSGEIWCLPDGRAAYHNALEAAASGDRVGFRTEGVCTVTKTSSVVILDGQPVYWDHSANSATFEKVNDKDFFLGTAVGDAASADTTMEVNLNVEPVYAIDIMRDGYLSVVTGTAAAGAFGYPVRLGGALQLEVTATNEAQCVDALSRDRFAVGANWIVEGEFCIHVDGSNSTQDFNIGVANGTHATDADSITESCFIHVDGGSTNLAAESDDGTTEVAATDTTIDYTEGAAVANRVHFLMDGRNPADIQIYINGVAVLTSTVFDISAATGPLGLLVHLEKSTGTDVYKIVVDKLAVRLMEQDNVQLVNA